MQEMMENLLKYGYILLFFYSLGGGMIGILAAAMLSSSGKLDLYLCMSLAFFANVLGSTLLFILGKYYKKDLAPYLKKHRRKFALATIKIKKYGVSLLIIQKFIYGLKTFIPIAAALAKYDFSKFFIINTLATLLWALSFGYLGFIFGHLAQMIFDKLAEFPYIAPLFLVFLVLFFWFYLSKFSKK